MPFVYEKEVFKEELNLSFLWVTGRCYAGGFCDWLSNEANFVSVIAAVRVHRQYTTWTIKNAPLFQTIIPVTFGRFFTLFVTLETGMRWVTEFTTSVFTLPYLIKLKTTQNSTFWSQSSQYSTVKHELSELFLLLARYVPNVAKEELWDQCKKYILTTDQRPTNDRPTSGPIQSHVGLLENFKWP